MTPSKAPLPFLGTWKLMKCETSHPGLPHPVSGITAFTQDEDAIHYSNDGIWSDGRVAKTTAELLLDGTWLPVTGSFLVDSLSLRRLDDGSLEVKMRKGGADVGLNRSKVSTDGRTLTGVWEILGPDGATVKWTTTSERQ